MKTSKLKIGFVGAGKQAQCAHIRNYATLDDCSLVAIADPDEALASKVATRYGIAQSFPSHAAMLATEKLDGIVMTLPAIPAAEKIICDILAAQIPLFVEKPLAYSVAAGERIVAAAMKAGTPLVVGYHKRSDPATEFAKVEVDRLKQTGELGALKYVRVHVSLAGDWISGGYRDAIPGSLVPGPTSSATEEFSGMSEQARNQFQSFAGANSHQFDLMRHLLGEDYRITYADPSGVLLAVESDHHIAGAFEFTPYESTKDWRESILVAFERGFVRVELPAPLAINIAGRVEVFRDETGTSQSAFPVFPARSALLQQAMNFLGALRGEPHHFCSPEAALQSLVIARDWALRLAPVEVPVIEPDLK